MPASLAVVDDPVLPGMEPELPPGGSITKPYYESDRVRLYLADACDVLPTLATNSVHLLCTDPPYGVRWPGNWRRKVQFGEMAGDDGSYDAIGVLTLATGGPLCGSRHVYVFGYLPDQVAGPLRLGQTAELIWDKSRAMLGSTTWAKTFERITFGTHAPVNAPEGTGELTARLRRGSVLRVPRKNGTAVNRHPTEKPVDLMRLLIESSSLPGDVVLDPFAGSGSTLVAAIVTGRKAVGIEIDPQYAQTAAARCRRAEAVADQINGL